MNRIVFRSPKYFNAFALRLKLPIVVLLLLGGVVWLPGQSSLAESITALRNEPVLKNGSVSVCVLDVESGKILGEYQSKRSLTPASSLKVATTAAALSILGADYRFKTQLEYDGTIDASGTLNGNLYIKGFGDPTLASPRMDGVDKMEVVLQKMVAAVKEAGIKKIQGKVVGDASWLGTQGSGRTWAYEDLGNYYGAGALGLNFHENLYYLTLQQTAKLGAQPTVKKVVPEIPNLLLINELKSAKKGSGDNAYIFGGPYTYACFVRGTIPVGSKEFKIKGSIPDPPFLFASFLTKELEANGIETSKRATTQLQLSLEGASNQKRQSFFTLQSPTLKEIVEETNMKSVNLYCEAMLRVLGKTKKGESTDVAGLEVVTDFWKQKGLQTDGFFMEDGSGLSPYNAVSAYHLATIMRLIKKDPTVFDAFFDSLPIAGKSGSLKYRLKGTAGEGNLRAKSGGLNRVRSFTGLAKNKSGKWVAFCVIANNYKGGSGPILKRMERIMAAVCN